MAHGEPAETPRADGTPGRPTIGLITANIHLGVGATLWSGVQAAAERNDVNVVCFPGGSLQPAGEPRNALYGLVGPDRLDGAICWTSTLNLPAADDEGTEWFVRRLGAIPVISLNRPLAGHETLRLDSSAGMREAVGHLVRDHGLRRIACLRGPLANPVSRDRFRAFRDALARHRVPLDRSLIAACADFGGGAGAAAMRVLLDVRGLRPGHDFDAVVVCSDVLAADVLRFLSGRGITVPEDVAVVGFNDSLDARLSDPPLTSVALPFADLGELAVDTLLAHLRGTRRPTRTVVPGALVVRRSCGCPSALVTQCATAEPDDRREDPGERTSGEVAAAFPHAGRELAAAIRADLAGSPPPASPGAQPSGGGFLPLVERVVGSRIHTTDDAADWDRALLTARETLIRGREPESRAVAERMLGQARLMVADKSHRLLEYERWAEDQEARRLRELGTALTTVVGLDGLTAVLAGHLPAMGVSDCHVALYEDGRRVAVPGDDPGTVRLAASGADAPYPAAYLLPDASLPRDRRHTLICEPLHIGDERLGFAVFDTGTGGGSARRGALYRALGDQISAALKGIRLFDEVRRARDAAQQADRLKTRLLDNATDELRTPVEAILRHCTAALGSGSGSGSESGEYGGEEPRERADAVRRVQEDAGRLLRLIDDLLDLSRSEIDALDLSRRLLDPRPVLAEAFRSVAGSDGGSRLRLPRRLPAVRADAPRLKQIVVNLLTAVAGQADARGPLQLSAATHPTLLRVRITYPAWSVSPGEDEYLFEPFASGEPGTRLGLAIARRLAILHGGSVTVDRTGGGRCGLHLDLPLPTPAELPVSAAHLAADGTDSPDSPRPPHRGHLLVAAAGAPPAELTTLAREHALRVRTLHPDDAVAPLVTDGPPAAVAWDTRDAHPQEWPTIQRLHEHPALRHTPFLLYGPVTGEDLGQALHALRPTELADPVVVVDDDARSGERLRRLLAEVRPGLAVRRAVDGAAARPLLAERVPRLLIVSHRLPDTDGFEVTERMCESAGRSGIPVLMLGDRGFTFTDVRRADPYPGMVLLGRDILTDAETARLLAALTQRAEPAAHRTYAPVRHAVAYLEQHYRHQFSRRQVAQAAGISGDHLSRLFHKELGLTLWEYLTRLRVQRAKEQLRHSGDSMQAVARAVGFRDRAYFSRVFRKVTGVAPHVYREAS